MRLDTAAGGMARASINNLGAGPSKVAAGKTGAVRIRAPGGCLCLVSFAGLQQRVAAAGSGTAGGQQEGIVLGVVDHRHMNCQGSERGRGLARLFPLLLNLVSGLVCPGKFLPFQDCLHVV